MLKGSLFIVLIMVLLAVVVPQLPLTEYNKKNDRDVVSEVFQIMKSNVITKASVDWTALENEIDLLFSQEQDDLLYNSIYKILETTNTGHSFYRSSVNPKFIMHKNKECKAHDFVSMKVPNDIGYIQLNSFGSGERDEGLEFIQTTREQILAYRDSDIKGWIVDLSNNSGGNMWPMLSSIAPLLGDGVHGYFAHTDGSRDSWSTKNGISYINEQSVIGIEDNTSVNHKLPIAVISSDMTSSSGEAILISFKTKGNVKTFGYNSCGMSTANKPFELSNGAQLFVTTSTMMDSSFTAYNRINVDFETNTPMKEAAEWIRSF